MLLFITLSDIISEDWFWQSYLFPLRFGDFYEARYNLKLMKDFNCVNLSFWIFFHIADFLKNNFDF